MGNAQQPQHKSVREKETNEGRAERAQSLGRRRRRVRGEAGVCPPSGEGSRARKPRLGQEEQTAGSSRFHGHVDVARFQRVTVLSQVPEAA